MIGNLFTLGNSVIASGNLLKAKVIFPFANIASTLFLISNSSEFWNPNLKDLPTFMLLQGEEWLSGSEELVYKMLW